MVNHHKHCCSYFGAAANKHETRQQSSSTIGLQLQQPTAATGSYSKGLQLPSLPLPLLRSFHGASSAINAGECNVRRRGGLWGSIRMNVDRHRGSQARRGADTSGTQHNYGNGARASPTPRASRAGVAITKMASEHGGLFYHWARAVPRVTFRSVTPISGAGHGTSRCPVPVPGANRSWDPELD